MILFEIQAYNGRTEIQRHKPINAAQKNETH